MTDPHAPQERTGQQEHKDENRVTHAVTHRLTSPPWIARAAGVGLSSVSIGFVVLFLFVLESGGNLTLFTRPLPIQIALALPSLIGILTLGTTAGALLGWQGHYWSLPVRVHQTVLASLGIAFSWQLSTLGFIAL